ncbi:pyruvate kinase, barrel domain-containing protein [Phthorimaea operculella]|nr:pyruvate kinase, barrel domain-containing protein [Phthorimaea operculella]
MWPTDFDSKLDEFDAMDLPGQQLHSAQALTPLDHVLNLDIKAPPACLRMTCIMACLGKSTNDIETLEKMMAAGMNIAVINVTFGNREEHIETIKMVRQAAKNFSSRKERNYPIAIALRLSGRKIRTGRIAETFGDTVELKTGESCRLTTDDTYREKCSMFTIYIDFLNFSDQLKKKNYILLDNEKILLQVEMISTTTVTCKIERGGKLGSYKDVYVPNVVFEMPNFSERDKLDIEMGIRHQVDIVIASFAHTDTCIDELRNLLGEKGKKIAIIASIQSVSGYKNLDDILKKTNGIMVTRQELGTDIIPRKLVIAQKNIIARANIENKPVFVTAHLLSGMRYNILAKRSELLDIANCIVDGADGLMLSAETAVGMYPVETVACMNTTCRESEAIVWTKQIFYDFVDKTEIPCDQTTATAIAAVLAAHRAIAAGIVVVTRTGRSAQIVAKFRPRCPILAVTRHANVARQLHMWRGVLPLIYEANPDPDWLLDIEKRIGFATKWGMSLGFIRIGDPIIVVSGGKQVTQTGSSGSNTMRIIYAANELVLVSTHQRSSAT